MTNPDAFNQLINTDNIPDHTEEDAESQILQRLSDVPIVDNNLAANLNDLELISALRRQLQALHEIEPLLTRNPLVKQRVREILINAHSTIASHLGYRTAYRLEEKTEGN